MLTRQSDLQMAVLSSNGPVSSRAFTKREMEKALLNLGTQERRTVRKLAREIDRRSSVGYYAALDTVAIIGVHLVKIVPNST